MSDGEVLAAIEQMEAWGGQGAWVPDPGALEVWHTGFLAAMETAEKGPGWVDLMARAHAVGRLLEAKTGQVEQVYESIKSDMKAQEQGLRALRGYGGTTR